MKNHKTSFRANSDDDIGKDYWCKFIIDLILPLENCLAISLVVAGRSSQCSPIIADNLHAGTNLSSFPAHRHHLHYH